MIMKEASDTCRKDKEMYLSQCEDDRNGEETNRRVRQCECGRREGNVLKHDQTNTAVAFC